MTTLKYAVTTSDTRRFLGVLIRHVIKMRRRTSHLCYIASTSYLRRGPQSVKLHDQDVLRSLFAEWVRKQPKIVAGSNYCENDPNPYGFL